MWKKNQNQSNRQAQLPVIHFNWFSRFETQSNNTKNAVNVKHSAQLK